MVDKAKYCFWSCLHCTHSHHDLVDSPHNALYLWLQPYAKKLQTWDSKLEEVIPYSSELCPERHINEHILRYRESHVYIQPCALVMICGYRDCQPAFYWGTSGKLQAAIPSKGYLIELHYLETTDSSRCDWKWTCPLPLQESGGQTLLNYGIISVCWRLGCLCLHRKLSWPGDCFQPADSIRCRAGGHANFIRT